MSGQSRGVLDFGQFLKTALIGAKILTHCGRVTQIYVYTLQLCKTDGANLRFNTRLVSTHYVLNYAIHGALLRMVLLTDVYRNVTSLRMNV